MTAVAFIGSAVAFGMNSVFLCDSLNNLGRDHPLAFQKLSEIKANGSGWFNIQYTSLGTTKRHLNDLADDDQISLATYFQVV